MEKKNSASIAELGAIEAASLAVALIRAGSGAGSRVDDQVCDQAGRRPYAVQYGDRCRCILITVIPSGKSESLDFRTPWPLDSRSPLPGSWIVGRGGAPA